MPRPSNGLLAQRAALVAEVARHKAAIRQHRVRLGAAKAALVELEAMCRRLGIGFRTEPGRREGGGT